MHRTSRAAFTLIELLVVVSIITILVALLLPAIQAAREAARRVICVSNLKKLGMAAQAFESVHNGLPPGAVTGSISGLRSNLDADGEEARIGMGKYHGYGIELYQYIEQNSIYNTYDFNYDYRSPSNLTARTTVVSTFLCPSTVGPPLYSAQSANPKYGTHMVTRTDYSPSTGITDDLPGNPRGSGALRDTEMTSLAYFPNGLSNAAIFFESANRPNHCQSRWKCSSNHLVRLGGGSQFDPASAGRTNLKLPINTTNDRHPFGFHPGGASMGFADGSVRFIQDSISPDILRSMILRSEEAFEQDKTGPAY